MKNIFSLAVAAVLLAVGGTDIPSTPAESQPPSPPTQRPRKTALVVAIKNYAPGTGWDVTSADVDVDLMKRALLAQGFDAVHVLREPEATREGIEKSIRERLLQPAGSGDVLVFHYSGHGQQVPDDGDDEIDGYDEALVPYDAPMRPPAGYDGAKHLRDDALHGAMQALRRKVGPTGNVVAFIDSCFSGAIFRGSPGLSLNRGRGGARPTAAPTARTGAAARGASEGGGVFEGVSGAGGGGEAGLAPYVVFSAARYDEVASDMRSGSGSLSFALAAALGRAPQGSTYRTLFEQVQQEMKNWVRNQPQVEGAQDAALFSGKSVFQAPFLPVLSDPGGGRVTIGGGSAGGLLPHSEVELHRAGAASPTALTLVARGEVVASQPATATVALASPPPNTRFGDSRAFVTRYAFGDLRLRVAVRGIDDAAAKCAVVAELAKISAVELSEAAPDVIVAGRTPDDRRAVVVMTPGSPQPILEVAYADRELGDRVANRIQDYARNQYLRRLDLRHPDYSGRLEIVPVKLTNCGEGEPRCDACQVDPIPLESFVDGGGRLRLPVGTFVKLRIHPPAKEKAFMAVLDLQPDGAISVLWPPPGRQEQTAAGVPRDLPRCWRLGEPLGPEVFLLVSSESWIDFEPFRTVPATRSRGPTDLGALRAFAPLFDDLAIRSRGAKLVPGEAITTHAVVFELSTGVPPRP